MKEIIMTFMADGSVKKETKGFSGGSCVKESEFIEDALGAKGKRRFKKEYYEQPVEEVRRLKTKG